MFECSKGIRFFSGEVPGRSSVAEAGPSIYTLLLSRAASTNAFPESHALRHTIAVYYLRAPLNPDISQRVRGENSNESLTDVSGRYYCIFTKGPY